MFYIQPEDDDRRTHERRAQQLISFWEAREKLIQERNQALIAASANALLWFRVLRQYREKANALAQAYLFDCYCPVD